ncbi:MAG: pseudaminic acid synthase [Candidatus Magasanikbacteria bacterium]|nr:pseudaminic acid synthase [Candidatus Magasanikbacteria bacterium]
MVKPFIIQTPAGPRKIGSHEPCFIVAEMSANHKQDYNRAVEIVRGAAAAGADAIKLQTYVPDSMTIDCNKQWFYVGGKDNPEAWKGQTFYELYQKAYTPREWHADLKKLAEGLGLVFFSAPFSIADVDFLETLDTPLYKIASYEATDIPLLKKVASTGKPVILSVGFATLEEIEFSVKTLRDAGVKDLALLHCVTSYAHTPEPEFTNLRTMHDLQNKFQTGVGFSDNNGGIEIPILAAAMGASIIEKHFLIESDEAFDSQFSLGSDDFKAMVETIRRNEIIMGTIHYGCQTPAEEYNRGFRRSLFVVKDIKQGEQFTVENVRSIRPACGLETKFYDAVLGKQATQDIERGTPLSWNLIKH